MRSLESLAAPLRRWFTARLGAEAEVELEGPVRIATGNSRAMLQVEVCYALDGRERTAGYVVRVEQGGVFGTSSFEEVRVMRALHAAGYPVARVRWLECDASVIGAPFFVMDRVAGCGENPELGSIRQSLRLLQRQHQLDWQRAGLAFLGARPVGRRYVLDQIDRWESVYRESCYLPAPLLEEAAAWLRANAPSPSRIALVHGDPGPGNYMFEEDRITAITDWEFAHLGDPDEDWVYLATLRGPGIMPIDKWRELFREEVGVEISDERWRYWETFNLFKGACANITALRVFSEGVNPAPNMVAVGTSLHLIFVKRVAELIGRS